MGEDVILVNIKSYIHPYFLSGYNISIQKTSDVQS